MERKNKENIPRLRCIINLHKDGNVQSQTQMYGELE